MCGADAGSNGGDHVHSFVARAADEGGAAREAAALAGREIDRDDLEEAGPAGRRGGGVWAHDSAAAEPRGRHNNLGNVLLNLEKRDEAIERYRQAIALKPDYVEAHANLAAALSVLQRWEESLAPLAEALRLNPNHAQAHHNLGTSCRRLGRFDEAIAGEKRAVELDPKWARKRGQRKFTYLRPSRVQAEKLPS